MKYLKQIGIVSFLIFSVLLSIKSGYAAEGESYNIKDIVPTTTKTLELEVNNSIPLEGEQVSSDLKIYKDISVKDVKRNISSAKGVIVDLDSPLSKGDSYSILSISGVEGSIEFKVGDSLENKEISNSALDGDDQGIEKVIIKDALSLEIIFLKNLSDEDFDFKIYKDIGIKSITLGENKTKLDVLLKDSLEDNSQYVGTVTLFEGTDLSKIDVDGGIYDFTTEALSKYEEDDEVIEEDEVISETDTEEDEEKASDEKSLEQTLLDALEGSTELNNDEEAADLLEGENELQNELNSAAEDPENIERTQLENVALGTEETPDTGAETWVLLLGTFIINTFYFLSRRKKAKLS